MRLLRLNLCLFYLPSCAALFLPGWHAAGLGHWSHLPQAARSSAGKSRRL